MTPAARDPQLMSCAERKAEIAEILARGFLALVARRKTLDLSGESEPSCATVDAEETRTRTPCAATGKEVA